MIIRQNGDRLLTCGANAAICHIVRDYIASIEAEMSHNRVEGNKILVGLPPVSLAHWRCAIRSQISESKKQIFLATLAAIE